MNKEELLSKIKKSIFEMVKEIYLSGQFKVLAGGAPIDQKCMKRLEQMVMGKKPSLL